MPVKLTPAFRAWFGDSKVVDAAGKPLVAYHGTDQKFTVFDAAKQGSTAGVKGGFFFVSDKNVASEVYGWRHGSRVMSVHLRMEHPLGYDEYFALTSKNKDIETNYGFDAPVNYFDNNADEVVAFAEANGFDGLMWPADQDSKLQHNLLMVFRPSQIKSTTGNSGDFDVANPDIRYSMPEQATINADSNVPTAAKPLSEKQFFSQYAQHIDLRGRANGSARATRSAILRDGFKKGMNVNAIPPYRGGVPRNLGDSKFSPRKGDVVYLAPKGAWKDGPNGMEIQDGWMPRPFEAIEVAQDYPSMHREYLSAFHHTHAASDGNAAFRRWFTDSKVVDATGAPLVVYHGTANPAWESGRSTFGTTNGMGEGAYFTPSSRLAEEYAVMDSEVESDPPFLIPVYLSIKNPKVLSDTIDMQAITPDQRKEWEASGHDGMMGYWNGKLIEIAVWNTLQIKFAIGNNGDFGATNPNIRFSMQEQATQPGAQSAAPNQPIQRLGQKIMTNDVSVTVSFRSVSPLGDGKAEYVFDVNRLDPPAKKSEGPRRTIVGSVIYYAGLKEPVLTQLYPSVYRLDRDRIISAARPGSSGGVCGGALECAPVERVSALTEAEAAETEDDDSSSSSPGCQP